MSSTDFPPDPKTGLVPMPSGIRPKKRSSDALNAVGVAWELLPGEGAFYGPKIEYSLKDSLGGSGNAAPSRLTSICPSGLERSMSLKTTAASTR